MFHHIRVGKFTFRIKALEDLSLPAYKGSTFRGGFGHALKQVSCALKRQECATCLLRDRCVYLYLFETPPPKDAEMMRLYPNAPHPFVIEPPENDARSISDGEHLEFGLILIGQAIEYLPYFVYAFTVLGERGIGKGRGRFSLDEVLTSGPGGPAVIYESQDQKLRQTTLYDQSEAVKQRCAELANTQELALHFLSPTRIKFDGRLIMDPEFHHLVRSLLRRLSSLSYFHCGRRLDLDFRGMIERAQTVKRVSSQVHWHDWERYSNRQKERMSLGGFIGRAVFSGELVEFLPLLALGETLHIGKAASFGLGRFEMRPP